MKTESLFSKEELAELKKTMEGIGNYLPTDKTSYIWSNYVKIIGKQEPRPCTCKSSGKLWAKAINTIREYLKKLDD